MTQPLPPRAPQSPLGKRTARLERMVADLTNKVASLHRSVAFLQEIGCVVLLVLLALLAVGVWVVIATRPP